MTQTMVVGCMVRKIMALGKDSLCSCWGHFMNSLKKPLDPTVSHSPPGPLTLTPGDTSTP